MLIYLIERKGGIVRLHHCVRHFGTGHDAVGVHDPVRVLFSDLGDE